MLIEKTCHKWYNKDRDEGKVNTLPHLLIYFKGLYKMKGIQISLTGEERTAIITAVTCYMEMMQDGDDGKELIEEELNNGLGSGLFKLYKGLIGANAYKTYAKKKR